MGVNSIVSFISGMLTEHVSTRQKLDELKRQILALSKKSAAIEDRHKKLLSACALYDIALSNVAKSTNKEVADLTSEFSPVATLLREGDSGWIERLRIKFEIDSMKKKYMDGVKGMPK
jgi:hypothetical protein